MSHEIALRLEELPDRCMLHVPQRDGDALDIAAARWNADRRDAALGRLEGALVGIDIREIASHPGPTQPALGEVVATRSTPLRAVLEAIADDLAAAWGARVTIASTSALEEAKGPVRGWYDHDLLVVPLADRAEISLTGPTVAAPVPGATAGPGGPEAWMGPIPAGMALLVPRGWGVTLAFPVARAELAVRRMRGTDAFAYVAAHAAGAEPFRENVPWDPAAAPPDPASVFGVDGGLRTRFAELDLGTLTRAATAAWHAALRGPTSPSAEAIESAIAHPHAPTDWAAPGGAIRIERLPHDAEPLGPGEEAIAIAGHLLAGPDDALIKTLEGRSGRTTRAALLRAGLLRPSAQ